MVNTDLLYEVADYFEAHPESYDFGWRNCIGGRAIRLAGGRFIPAAYSTEMCRPMRDDPPGDVLTDSDGVRYVEPQTRATRICGLTERQGWALFIGNDLREYDEGGRKAPEFIRGFAAAVEASDDA